MWVANHAAASKHATAVADRTRVRGFTFDGMMKADVMHCRHAL
jgi:hypothetical protein